MTVKLNFYDKFMKANPNLRHYTRFIVSNTEEVYQPADKLKS